MGSVCGKQSEDTEPLPARPSNVQTLGGPSSSSPAKKFTLKQKPKIGGVGRTLGSSSAATGGGGGGGSAEEGARVDARSAAAIAATNREDAAKATAKKSRLLQTAGGGSG